MRRVHYFMTAIGLLPLYCLSATAAPDLDGAWASDASVCSKVFAKSNNKVTLTPDAELYGGGLIVEGKRADGTFQNCKLKSAENDGTTLHLIAACSTGVMVSDVKVTVKVLGPNQIMVSPGGPVNVDTSYVRCYP